MSRATRIQQEAALASRLHHPRICSMRETIFDRGDHYIVFEYVSGGNLLDYVIRHGRLRERPAKKLARQIGSALDYCHRNSVVHRSGCFDSLFPT
jgi:serine/threonine protein kinase